MKGKLAQFFASYAKVCENTSASDRAILEERYATLRRQVPVIYVVAVANLGGLMLATAGKLTIGLNFPTLLAVCAVVRIAQWLRAPARITHAKMRSRLHHSALLTAIVCSGVSLWCLHLISGADASTRMAVMLFGGLTAIGAAYGLSVLPIAAVIPIIVLALPLAGTALVSRDPQLAGAALSLTLVASLILRILIVHNARFALRGTICVFCHRFSISRKTIAPSRNCSNRPSSSSKVARPMTRPDSKRNRGSASSR